jgi:hypothetical protein
MLRKPFGKWLSRRVRRAGAPRPRAVCPRLEYLEDRLVPDAVSNTGDSGSGSLRQAILDANSGVSTAITFTVAGTITPATPLRPLTRAGTVIDATTAPGFANTPVVALDGSTTHGTGLDVEANTVTIKGLAIINWSDGIDIGLTNAVTGTTIQRNFVGITTDGGTAGPNTNGIGVFKSANALIGGASGSSPAPSNVISGNTMTGIDVVGGAGTNSGTAIQDNIIGPAFARPGPPATGGVAQFQGSGILVQGGAVGTLIGGPGQGNQIFDNVNGIQLLGGTGTLVQGNTIGLLVSLTGKFSQPNSNDGVLVNTNTASPVTIGGTTPETANTISVSQHDGVEVMAGTSGVAILGNPIFASGNLGIELHDGANNNATPPVLGGAVRTSDTTVVVSGSLTAAANTTYRLEFFDTSFSFIDAGVSFVAAESVTTDPTGNASFSLTLSVQTNPDPNGTDLITATATDPVNNTSQFSAEVTVTPPPSPGPGPAPLPPSQSFDTRRVFWDALLAADGFLTGNLLLFLAGALDFRSLSSPLSGPTLGQAQQQFSANFSWSLVTLIALGV